MNLKSLVLTEVSYEVYEAEHRKWASPPKEGAYDRYWIIDNPLCYPDYVSFLRAAKADRFNPQLGIYESGQWVRRDIAALEIEEFADALESRPVERNHLSIVYRTDRSKRELFLTFAPRQPENAATATEIASILLRVPRELANLVNSPNNFHVGHAVLPR